MTWTQQAGALGEDAAELGATIAAIHTAAWRARIDPDATAGLAGAATALWAPAAALYGRGQPLPSDRILITTTEDCEIEAGELSRAAQRARTVCTADLSRAYEAHRDSVALLRAASAGEVEAQASAIREQLRGLERQIADCEGALEILGEIATRVAYAAGCLQRVPDDLAETYEAAYRLLAAGGKLPRNTDFLTATLASPAA
jgi:hypothetical protein